MKGGGSLLEVLFLLLFSTSWSLTLRDVAPIIGFTVMVIIVVVIVIVTIKWYRYWVKKGIEEMQKKAAGKT